MTNRSEVSAPWCLIDAQKQSNKVHDEFFDDYLQIFFFTRMKTIKMVLITVRLDLV